MFDDFFSEERIRQAWESVRMERSVEYGLFTFGDSDLPYILVLSQRPGQPVIVQRGAIKITRPLIITPDSAQPEFQNFFEGEEDLDLPSFLMARTAMFSHLRLRNEDRSHELKSDSVVEVVEQLNRRLDDEEEDRVAILSAPRVLRGIALVRYAAHRIAQSTPANIQELREKGFLP